MPFVPGLLGGGFRWYELTCFPDEIFVDLVGVGCDDEGQCIFIPLVRQVRWMEGMFQDPLPHLGLEGIEISLFFPRRPDPPSWCTISPPNRRGGGNAISLHYLQIDVLILGQVIHITWFFHSHF